MATASHPEFPHTQQSWPFISPDWLNRIDTLADDLIWFNALPAHLVDQATLEIKSHWISRYQGLIRNESYTLDAVFRLVIDHIQQATQQSLSYTPALHAVPTRLTGFHGVSCGAEHSVVVTPLEPAWRGDPDDDDIYDQMDSWPPDEMIQNRLLDCDDDDYDDQYDDADTAGDYPDTWDDFSDEPADIPWSTALDPSFLKFNDPRQGGATHKVAVSCLTPYLAELIEDEVWPTTATWRKVRNIMMVAYPMDLLIEIGPSALGEVAQSGVVDSKNVVAWMQLIRNCTQKQIQCEIRRFKRQPSPLPTAVTPTASVRKGAPDVLDQSSVQRFQNLMAFTRTGTTR